MLSIFAQHRRWVALAPLLCALVCGAVVLTCSVCVSAATILDYTVTSVTSAEMEALPRDHWAHYTSLCRSGSSTQTRWDVSQLSMRFPATSPSQMRAAFYAYNSTPWHVTNMGFLSPTPYGMCNGVCTHDFFATLQGNYGFSDNTSVYYDGGGDWPMISFYLAPFHTSDMDPAISFVLTQEHFEFVRNSSSGPPTSRLASTLVEYCNVPLQGVGLSAGGLTAQVEVHANGTIVMRYDSLPPEDALPGYVRSTGLIYSKTLRKVVATPTASNGIVAYRFDPVYDVCDGAPTASACAALNMDDGNGDAVDCVWCASTSACASRAFVSEVCPRGQWAMSAAEAGAGAQKFYDVSVDYNGAFIEDIDPTRRLQLNGLTQFYLDATVYSALFNSNFWFITCSPGLSCAASSSSTSCNSINNTCPDGKYTRTILALQSALQWSEGSYVISQTLPTRWIGRPLCYEPQCAAGIAILLNATFPFSSSSNASAFVVQLSFDRAGVIDMVITNSITDAGAPLLTFPSTLVGLVRYGVEDASSVLVPQALLRSGVHIRFVPRTSCQDCGLHGSCDEATGTCGCMAGHYGASCKACPACWGGSRCDDGVAGSGACVCDGGACGATCGGVAERSCVGCSAVGGRCECGVCVCVDGWSGARCDVPPVDACRAYSLDGCAVCGQHEGCVFCFDSTCFNASLSGTSSGYICSYSTPAADTRACRTYGSLGPLPSDSAYGAYAVLGCIVALLVVELLLVTGIIVFACRSRRVIDPADFFAVGSAVGLTDPPREREVIQVSFARRKAPGASLVAIPLKQVSLKRLFNRRKEAKVQLE